VPDTRRTEWILRVATAMIFAGHGWYALHIEPSWIVFFHTVGLSTEAAHTWMPLVGALDLAVAAIVLVRPVPVVLMWMVLWATWTALLRPLSGTSIFAAIERGGNIGAPLALLFLRGFPRTLKELFR
jgi:hypothetical protein